MGRIAPALAASAALALGAASLGAEFAVPLTVQESAGVARRAEPVSGGVPLPRGRFPKDQRFALLASDGRELPCQTVPLVVETDGSLRWVLLDFQDDVAAGATAAYVLKAATPAARPASALRIEDGPDGLTVDTGRIRFSLSRRKPFALFDSVQAGGKTVATGREVSYVQMQGRKGWDDPAAWQPRKLLAGPPETLRVHCAGPLRVTVEVGGHFADDPLKTGYRAWITAWAGSSRVHVKYSLCNSNPDRYTAVLVSRSSLALDVPAATRGLVGAATPLEAAEEGWIHHGLRPDRPLKDVPAVRAGDAARVLWTSAGAKAPPAGWLAAPDAGLFVCDVLFATNPARRLAIGHGRLVLDAVAEKFPTPADDAGRRAQPWAADGFWLYDSSHHSSEYLFDFAAPSDAAALDALARAARNRLWVLAPGAHYAACNVLMVGHFGTLDDEKACYTQWGWTWKEKQVPAAAPRPGAFVAWEDNHYESEADSVEGLLLMYLRTGQRGWFDLAEGWARYHMDLQSWRTDGWRWKDGAVWFPQGGPQGNRRTRQDWSFAWGPDWGNRKGSPDCADLWRHSQAKSCYCHFYGSGLVDYYCLTGERDALEAAIDNVETKDEEFRRSKQYVPGRTPIGETRGFGRGFEVMMRVLMADPANTFVADLCHLAARTLWQSPLLDERGFHCRGEGAEAAGLPVKDLSPNVRRWMQDHGVTFTERDGKVDTLSRGDLTWKVRSFGGTWEHAYVHNGADLYARYFDDEDLRDFVIGFAQMTARYLLSPQCHQTWYKTVFDVPDRGRIFDPWVFDHADTTDGVGCVHSGYYTRFFPDACAKGYSWTGERPLLERGKEFWAYGSRREYQRKEYSSGPNEVGKFAGHLPPKDDEVLSTGRLFYEWTHPRTDGRPPAAVRDLAVRLLGDGRAEVRFTAPADAGGGKVARYQVKAAPLPLVAYEDWDDARDPGRKRNWWMATNCRGEPPPGTPGAAETFTVTGVPEGRDLYFAVRSVDNSWNRSALSNVVRP